MVVLLEELKIESVSNLSSEDALELVKPLSLGCVPSVGLKSIHDLLSEGLVLIVEDVESNLVGN